MCLYLVKILPKIILRLSSFAIKITIVNCVWDNLLKSQGCCVVNLFHREVPRVLNIFPGEFIEGNSKNFLKANKRPLQRPDPEGFWSRVWPKKHQMVCLMKILRGAFNQLPREQVENSRNFLGEQIHHATPQAFQQIDILTKSLQCLPEENPAGAFNQLPREQIENSMS